MTAVPAAMYGTPAPASKSPDRRLTMLNTANSTKRIGSGGGFVGGAVVGWRIETGLRRKAWQSDVPAGVDSGAKQAGFRNHPGQYPEMEPGSIPGWGRALIPISIRSLPVSCQFPRSSSPPGVHTPRIRILRFEQLSTKISWELRTFFHAVPKKQSFPQKNDASRGSAILSQLSITRTGSGHTTLRNVYSRPPILKGWEKNQWKRSNKRPR